MKFLAILILSSFLLLLAFYVVGILAICSHDSISADIWLYIATLNLFIQPILIGISCYKIKRVNAKWPLLLILNITIVFYLLPTTLFCLLLVGDYLNPQFQF